MKYFTVLLAVLPALILAADIDGGATGENPLSEQEIKDNDNPAIAASSSAVANATSSAVITSATNPAETILPGVDAPTGTGTTVVAQPVATGATNSTPADGAAGGNGTNSTGAAEARANTISIAGFLAAAGAVGALIL